MPHTAFEALTTHADNSARVEDLAREFALNPDARRRAGTDSRIWVALYEHWHRGASVIEEMNHDYALETRRMMGVAKVTRNMVAGVPENQVKAFVIEPEIRRLLYAQTSFVMLQDTQTHALTRLLTQTLSNIITDNDPLMYQLWTTYMSGREDQLVLIRLLASPDERTVLATLVLITNCIHMSEERATQLTATPTGIRLCVCLLDCIAMLYEAGEESEAGKAFDVGYNIFVRLAQFNLIPTVYCSLSTPNEPITPHQTTLLKILDSYLHSHDVTVRRDLAVFLSKAWMEMGGWVEEAVRNALKEGELNVLLPKVCEAIVLITLCFVSMTLDADASADSSPLQTPGRLERNQAGGDEISMATRDDQERNGRDGYLDARRVLVDAVSGGEGLIERLIGLLRLLDEFIPKLNLGKSASVPLPSAEPTSGSISTDPTGFSYLKRALVRLLGILCHKNRAVQDRVRTCGGISVMMGMCVVDDRSPYLREHAILTLRNLLEDNLDNQAVVQAIH